MKSVDTGNEKVKKICEVLRMETIDPAKKEGEQIIAKARADGEKIVADAKRSASRMIEDAKRKMDEERNVFEASINLACKKSIESLKESIMKNLFDPALTAFFNEKMRDPKVAAELIEAIVCGIEKEGISGDLRAIVSSAASVEAVNKELMKEIIERLETKSVMLSEIEGGAQVKVIDGNFTIDMSELALKNLLAGFARDDFRSIIFAKS